MPGIRGIVDLLHVVVAAVSAPSWRRTADLTADAPFLDGMVIRGAA
jgi:hypothetical protein